MRSKSLFAAAIALAIVCAWLVSPAHAEPKGRAAAAAAAEKKKAAELHADEKRAELEKIARAHAINEKAEKDKERQAALQPVAPAPAPAKANVNRKNEVALPSTAPAEKPSDTPHEISPKLASEAAKAPPPPVTKGDDKFIDKLLKEERVSSKKKTNPTDDEIKGLLAGVKSGRKGKGDSVDDLLKSADKGPAMPAPRAATALPDWTKTPDIAPATPAHAPIAAKAPAKKNDGVIQVVQGAASFTPPASFAPPPPPPPPVATRTTSRKTAGRTAPAKAQVADWNDPFAEGSSSTKTVATRDRDRSEHFTPAASVTKKEPASVSRPTSGAGWSDPFADAPETRKTTRRTTVTAPAPAAPTSPPKREKSEPAAHPPGWKDPFTKVSSPEPARAQVAMRELGKNESSKWEIAAHRVPSRATSSDSHATGGWAVLKKQR